MTKTASPVDMSPAAVARRLETVRALYKLCQSLKHAGRAAGLHHRGPVAPSLTGPTPDPGTGE
jgi:hypothetical protein